MSEQPEVQVPCPDPNCGATGGHYLRCSLAPLEVRLANFEQFTERQTRLIHDLRALLQRHRELAVLWHGKFALVKHENNCLRKKLRRQDSSHPPVAKLGPPSSDRWHRLQEGKEKS